MIIHDSDGNPRPIRVLVVEDEEPIQRALARSFVRLGMVTFATGSAEAALRILEREPIDVVITDVQLPGESGLWLMRQIRERFARVPVVICSGTLPDDEPAAFACFAKPVSLTALAETVVAAAKERHETRCDQSSSTFQRPSSRFNKTVPPAP